MNFMNAIEETMNTNSNISITENGNIGYKSTGSKLLDLSFQVSSFRTKPEEFAERWYEIYKESPEIALRFLFYVRDVRRRSRRKRDYPQMSQKTSSDSARLWDYFNRDENVVRDDR